MSLNISERQVEDSMDPVTVAKIAKLAADQLKSEENRRKLLIAIISMAILAVYLFSVSVYIVTNPIDALLGGEKIEISDNIHITESHDEEAIWKFLIDIGFSEVGAAATLGNMEVESHLNPSAGSGHYGICQWGGGRYQELIKFSLACGTAWNDLETQLNYFRQECALKYSAVYREMQHATDIVYATDFFCVRYEICPGMLGNWAVSVIDGKAYQGLADRRAYAEKFYRKYASN